MCGRDMCAPTTPFLHSRGKGEELRVALRRGQPHKACQKESGAQHGQGCFFHPLLLAAKQ